MPRNLGERFDKMVSVFEGLLAYVIEQTSVYVPCVLCECEGRREEDHWIIVREKRSWD